VSRPRQGFTLFELVLVLAVLILLAAITYPSLDDMYAGMKVTQTADQLRAAFSEARAHAANESRAYRIAIIPGHGNFRVAPDSPEFWAGSGPPSADDTNGIPAYVLEGAAPKGVRIATSDAVGAGDGDSALPEGSIDLTSWMRVVTFAADGTTQDDAELAIYGNGGPPTYLRLRGLTGIVTVRQQSAGVPQR
jgi:prepilin-type N-terminal cleavage/methylation domain-containing protein